MSSTCRPTDRGFAEHYSRAWTEDVEGLIDLFAPDGSYTDVAMGVTYEGHAGLRRFYRFMLRFAPDSEIRFGDTHASDGHLCSEWVWSGTCTEPLRLRSGALIDRRGVRFSVPGVAVCSYREDGLITSHRDFWDLATVLHQAGVPIG